MPRVLYVVDSLYGGGAERQLSLLAQHLPPNWKPRIWSLGGGPFEERIRAAGIPLDVHARASQFDVSPALDLWRLLWRWRPAVVHAWGWMSASAGAPACRLLNIPFVDGTIRSGSRAPRHRLEAIGQMVGVRLARRVVANSEAGLSAWNIGARRGRVVYNGFDPARLPEHAAPAWTPDKPFTVIMTARMNYPHKDFRSLIGAARELAQSDRQGWRFMAVGNGALRSTLMAEARDLIETGVMEFPEAGLEVMPLVGQSHAGVLMTASAFHAEGCSNSIMEYMAWGLPVVCSEGGGNREVVLDGRIGYVVPSGDAHALAARLHSLREHAAEAHQMGLRGRDRLHDVFSVETMVRRMVEVYREAMHGRA